MSKEWIYFFQHYCVRCAETHESVLIRLPAIVYKFDFLHEAISEFMLDLHHKIKRHVANLVHVYRARLIRNNQELTIFRYFNVGHVVDAYLDRCRDRFHVFGGENLDFTCFRNQHESLSLTC